MSRSGLSRSATAGDATRQKLDELDALIQQMLNLPVNRLDPDWTVAEAEDRGQRTEDREQETENREQRAEDTEPNVKTEDREQNAEDSVPVAEEDRPSQAVVLSSVPCPSSADGPVSPGWWLYPVLALNLLFDGLTFLLGPVGRWLRGETGRLLMGWVGVGLFLAGLVWAFLGWLGWIK